MKRLTVIALLIMALGVLAFPVASTGSSSSSPSTVIVVLFDLTESTQSSAIRTAYLRDFQLVLGFASTHHGVVFGDVIDRDPLSNPEIPLQIQYPASSFFTSNLLSDRTNASEITATAMKACAELLDEKATGPGTAILDTLSIASTVFTNYQSTSKYLVILSDGIEQSRRLTFTQAALAPRAVARLIASDRQQHRLPELSGVKVYFAGAGATAIDPAGLHKAWEVRNFWLTYFKATGASLPASRYGTVLVRFP